MQNTDPPNADAVICLNKEFSTTRMLTRQKPLIANQPSDKFETMLFLPEGQGRKGEGGLRTKGYFKYTLPGKPLISIITVVLNCEKHLEKTIQSILQQTYDNVEYIVIDGCSTDRTLDIIKKHEDNIDYWVSEKDNGIYDAMNKGIKLAVGNFIGLVNGDDIIYESVLETIADMAINNPDMGYTYGEVDLMGVYDRMFGRSTPLPRDAAMARLYQEMPYRHLSVFVAKRVYKAIGLFDTSFPIRADYDLVIRMIKSGCTGYEVPTVVGGFRCGGVSGDIRLHFETRRLLKKHGVPAWKRELNFIDSMTKTLSYVFLPRSLINFLRKFRKSMNVYHPDA